MKSGVLLYGPPGCGKTLIGSTINQACGLNIVTVKGPEVLNKYIGASEQAVRDVFAKAKRSSPCILFFDEFEAAAGKRGHAGVTDRVVNQLLCELDGVEARGLVYVVAASSRPEMIDPALLRPGRLDVHLYCGFPNEIERLDILNKLCKKANFEVILERAAKESEGFTASDLTALINNLRIKLAKQEIEQITEENLLETLHELRPAFSPSQIKAYERQYTKFREGESEEPSNKQIQR